MFEIIESVELTWGAPDLNLFKSYPHTTRIHGGEKQWGDNWTAEKARELGRINGLKNGKPVRYKSNNYPSITAAAGACHVSTDAVRRAIQSGQFGCRYL